MIKIGVWIRWFPPCFPLKWAQASRWAGASVSSLLVRIWNFSFETNTGSGFPFLFYVQSEATTFSNASRTPFHPTAHKNSNRAGFCFGVGSSSSSKNTCTIKKVWYAAEKGRTARSSMDGKTWHPNWDSCRRGIQFVIFICVSLYYRAKCFSSSLETWKWASHSFRAVYWPKLVLVWEGHLAGHCPLYIGVCIQLW